MPLSYLFWNSGVDTLDYDDTKRHHLALAAPRDRCRVSQNFIDIGEPMKARHNLAIGLIAMALSTIGFAQAPASASTAQSGSSATPLADQSLAAKKAARAANRMLAKQVQQTIFKTKGLDDTEIAVFAKAGTGTVTLAGSLADESQEHIATKAARSVPGVKSVTSMLVVREGS
jgi:hyperosmotically inducible periplasmic protein